MFTYVAFLRGINIQGSKVIKMVDLRKAFELLGFSNVRTVIASGNVIFDTEEKDEKVLRDLIESNLAKLFGSHAHVMLRELAVIQKLVKANPFKGISAVDEVRLYVTFLGERPNKKQKAFKPLFKELAIVKVTNGEVFSAVTLTDGVGTVDAMTIIEKEFGKKVTMRNWNTVMKIANIDKK